jgi:hypothetical protein
LPAPGVGAEESEELSADGAAEDASAAGAALDAAEEAAAGAAEEEALPCAKAGALVASAIAPKRATIGWIFSLNIVRQFLIGLTGWTQGRRAKRLHPIISTPSEAVSDSAMSRLAAPWPERPQPPRWGQIASR